MKEVLKAIFEVIQNECKNNKTCKTCKLASGDVGCFLSIDLENTNIDEIVEKVLSLPLNLENTVVLSKEAYENLKFNNLEIPENSITKYYGESFTKHDNVNSPAHYCKGGIECIEAIKAAVVGLVAIEAVCTANVIKYLWRWKFKNGLEDLKKAKWYLDRLIKEVEEGNNVNS